MTLHEHVQQAAAELEARAGAAPDLAIVLGSGLGEFADTLASPAVVPYGAIPHWPEAAVVGHAGKLVAGASGRRRVAALAGRVHFYEGYSMDRVTFGVRTLAMWGVKRLVLTNAAGGINTSFAEGALMVIDDHLNLFGTNPLVGPNDERFGPRFPDMSEVYSKRLRAMADEAAAGLGVTLAHGVYAGLHGPSYETPAEIRMLRTLGADAVGMSTVPEAIVARHMGLEVLGISCITNMAAGVLDRPLDHREVMETAARVKATFIGLVEGIIARVPAGGD
ncbi:MAG: purine-nucleoside phosphorylase [Vicinamibacteraceae bacterium]|nr:purine-nucleoside phosphorylase [Vicinamibacteraceae bacterium]